MSLTVPSLRPEPPIHPFGPVLRSRCFGRFSGRSVGGALGPRRPALQAGPCPLRVEADEAPAPSASASAVPSQPCWWPLDLLAFSGSGREPFHFSSVRYFFCRAGRAGGDVPIRHASLSHRPAWAACCAWLGTKENNRTPDSRPGCHGDASVDVVGGRPEPPPPGPLGGSPLRFPAPVLGSSLPPARGDVRPLPFPSSSDPLLPRVP